MTKRILAATALLIIAFTPTHSLMADERSDLQAQIDAKKGELDRINLELDTTKANLEGIQKQKQALQREISTLENSQKELDLSIKSDQITIEKLGLEINSLNYNLSDIELAVAGKEQGIQDVFRAIQRTDGDNMLVLFLRQDSLENALTEVQSLSSLKNQLGKDISDLNTLHDQYSITINDIKDKKSSIQIHTVNLKNRKLIVADQKQTQQAVLEQTKNQEGVYQSKLSDLQKQQDVLDEEIGQIEDKLRQSFDVNVLPTKRRGLLDWPILEGGGITTQHFGTVSKLYRGRPHNGLDIGTPIGTPVVAAADGIVQAVDNNDVSRTRKYQYGKYILIKHPNNLATLYAHLSQQIVVSGQSVKKGEVIGYSGSTGYATGPHLHLGLYWAPSIKLIPVSPARGLVPIGVALNPEDYL